MESAQELVKPCIPDWIVIWKCWFWGERKTGVSGEKPLRARTRTDNKLNPYMASALRFQPRPDWWEASALTTASPTQCSGGSRHLDKGWGGGVGGRSSRPWDKGGTVSLLAGRVARRNGCFRRLLRLLLRFQWKFFINSKRHRLPVTNGDVRSTLTLILTTPRAANNCQSLDNAWQNLPKVWLSLLRLEMMPIQNKQKGLQL